MLLRFALEVHRSLASEAALSRRQFSRLVRVSFAKVAEYQRRGLIHFHAIARLVGHSGTAVTKAVYRKQIRPVLLQGAAAVDDLFAR
ncbi:replication initiator [Nonomuraea sp. NPDC049158]|uniref:replication initiator n=1 Tax=Nonomuraea sp. NPDC049158 TaxID=3155649 RepID=UPI0033EA52FB